MKNLVSDSVSESTKNIENIKIASWKYNLIMACVYFTVFPFFFFSWRYNYAESWRKFIICVSTVGAPGVISDFVR